MAEQTTTIIGGNRSQTQNGPTSSGQNQMFGDSNSIATLTASTNKGGMRGIGLLAVVIAEASLKKKSIDIAEDYLKLNRKDYDFFRTVHQGQIAATAAEAMSPTANPSYLLDMFTSPVAGMAKSAIVDKQWFETRRRTGRYATGLQKRVDYDFALLRTHAIVGGWSLGYRYEMAWTDAHNNARFDKMVQVANIGIGIGNIVRQGLATSSAGVAAAFDNIGDTVASIGNGLATRQGHNEGRQFARRRTEELTNG